ncbi:P2X purinoceptor 4-like [Dysidea avara]|uniref:P2X purinoceptor 4-like n=1 Tax=Dysidea avara TaxID=196820 RepID=UPI00331D7587
MSFWQKAKGYTTSSLKTTVDAVLEYDTPKIVHIKNKTVGLVNRLVQLGIIVYIVVFAIYFSKGYAEFEDVVSTVTTKVEGFDYTNGTGNFSNAGERVWDASDYIIPPQSPNSVFIMTNMWITNQTQGVCVDKSVSCNDTVSCSEGSFSRNGRLTGDCDNDSGHCLVNAWCPLEEEDKNMTVNAGPKLLRARNFTIFIKNSIQFPNLASSFRRRNVGNGITGECRFGFEGESYFCPIISVQQIINMLENRYTFEDLATQGSVLGLQIDWDCNLNKGPEDCIPVYSARRLDDPKAKFSPGFNFRYANSWRAADGTLQRELIKAYGIRINILVTGLGAKFSFPALILKIGSGIALLALASVISDIFILYVLRQRNYYRKKKYQNVEGGASLFVAGDDTNKTKLPPQEDDPLLGSQRTDDDTSGDESSHSSVNKNRKNHRRRYT